jgi:hypothetical protein
MNDNAFGVVLQDWAQAREPLATAMNAAMAPFVSALTGLDLSSRDAMARQDLGRRDRLTALFLEALRAGPWPLSTGW